MLLLLYTATMFALRPLARQARQARRLVSEDAVQMQQRRGMAGGEDDGVHRCVPSGPSTLGT